MISLRRYLPVLGILCFAVLLGAQEPPAGSAGKKRAAAQPAAAQPAPAGENAGHAAKPEQGPPGSGAERQPEEASSEAAAEEEPLKLFGKWIIPGPVVEALKWANFLALFGLLGWLLRKPLKEFLAARAAQIREYIEAGRRAREQAAARLKEIEAQLRRLGADIDELKQAASTTAQAERERLRKAAEAEAARILTYAQQEIEAASKAARSQLKAYAADLAVDLAEQRVRTLLTPDRQAALVRKYAATLMEQ